MSRKIITGVKPTGSSMHLGNLMGAVLPFKNIAEKNDSAIFIADLHAITSVKDGSTLRDQSFELAVEYFSIFGIDSDIKIFRQSDIQNITKLMWILANVTPYSLMRRAHSFKESEQKIELKQKILFEIQTRREFIEENINNTNVFTSEYISRYNDSKEEDELFLRIQENLKEIEQMKEELYSTINMGVFNYPILMAADIIGYGCDGVPVGKDQIQHLEMTRDMVRNFNKTYGKEIFIEPEAIVTEGLATLPGTDGRKMSKSYDNFIGVFDDEKTMKKRVMSIMTDSLGVDDIKNPDTCNVFALINVFGTSDEVETIRQKYLTPNIGFGYGHAKSALLDILQRYLSGYREARENLLKHPEIVEEKLRLGAIEMNKRLDVKMQEVREVVGVN